MDKIMQRKININLVAKIGTIFSIVLLLFSFYNLYLDNSPTMYVLMFWFSFFLFLGFAYYFQGNIRFGDEVELIHSIAIKSRIAKTAAILLSIDLLAIVILLNSVIYVKPFIYYILISVAVGLVFIQITFLSEKKDHGISHFGIFVLVEIIFVTIILRSASIIINPYLIGPDTLWHYHEVEKILESGFLSPSASHYFYYPLFHLTQAIDGSILRYVEGSFDLVNICLSSIAIMVAYPLGKELFKTERAGLFSALFLSFSTMAIFLADYNTSKIGGLTLLILGLFIIIRIQKTRNFRLLSVFWIISIAIFFWHPEISLAMMAILIAHSFIFLLFHRRTEFLTSMLIYFSAFTGYLVFVNTTLFSNIVQGIFIESPPRLLSNYSIQSITPSLFVQLSFAYLGITLLVFYSTAAILKRWNEDKTTNIFIVALMMCLLSIPFIGLIFGNFGINPERTLTYIAVILAVLSAGGVAVLLKKGTRRRILIQLVSILILSFFSTSSYLIGDGNDIQNNQIIIGTTYTTHSNLASYSFLILTPQGSSIISDYETIRYTTDSQRGYLSLQDRRIITYPNSNMDGYLVYNTNNINRLRWEYSEWGRNITDYIAFGNLVYNNNQIRIYLM